MAQCNSALLALASETPDHVVARQEGDDDRVTWHVIALTAGCFVTVTG